MISATVRLRLKPWRPVEQNVHSSAQPTCDDMHKVPRSSSGINTVSMLLPAPLFLSSTPISHLRVPSLEICSELAVGGTIHASLASFSRRDLAISVICSKSFTPKSVSYTHLTLPTK